MIRSAARIFTAIVLVLLVLGGGLFVTGNANPITNAATTTMLQNGSLVGQVEQALRENSDIIAQNLGMSPDDIDEFVTDLDLSSWEAVDRPANATPVNEYSGEYGGASVSATIYDDPEYITVSVAGQEVTLRVSDAASEYLRLLR